MDRAEALMIRAQRQAILLAKAVWQRVVPRAPVRTYVFVAGMQRSGTNMVMDVLERSLGTDVYHENDPRAFERYEMRDPAVIRQLATASRAPFFVIKALCELDLMPGLMQTFSPAKALWILRDVEDVVNSATRSFRNFPAQVGRIAQDRDGAQWRGRGMSDETHARVLSLYHPDMNEPTAAALTWYFRNILFFENGFDRDPRVRLVRYERLVTEPQAQFGELFRFLGIPYSPRISSIVSARSIRKNPPPPIEPEVRALCEALNGRFAEVFEDCHARG
ncbi:MAG TPA: sulfotransferase domain-containing protein [Rhodocyclaceae bacterium]|nr:sulfotransferase domain-containing protein [Rhodocyclaceae bacterium]